MKIVSQVIQKYNFISWLVKEWDIEGKKKEEECKNIIFYSLCFESLYFFVPLPKPRISFPKTWKIIFLLLTVTESHDCCLAPNISFLATLLLLQPMPMLLPQPIFIWRPRFSQCPWWEYGIQHLLKLSLSWWFKSCCFCNALVSFSHPILNAETNYLGLICLFSENLRMECCMGCRDLNHTIRILFWTFAQLDELISQERDVG